jgi:hypothetical protein
MIMRHRLWDAMSGPKSPPDLPLMILKDCGEVGEQIMGKWETGAGGLTGRLLLISAGRIWPGGFLRLRADVPGGPVSLP